MVHLVTWVHDEWLGWVRLQFVAAEAILLPEIQSVHLGPVVVFQTLDLIKQCQVADLQHLRLILVVDLRLMLW